MLMYEYPSYNNLLNSKVPKLKMVRGREGGVFTSCGLSSTKFYFVELYVTT
jgi:hypothetical protein